MADDLKYGLPPVEGTLRRKGGYSTNLRIDPIIRDQFGRQEHHRKSLRTRDPHAAKRAVRRTQVELDDAVMKARAAQVQNTVLDGLTDEQRRLFFSAGGIPGLLESFRNSQTALTFMDAGDPSRSMETDEERDPLQAKIEIAEHGACLLRHDRSRKSPRENVECPGPDGKCTGR